MPCIALPRRAGYRVMNGFWLPSLPIATIIYLEPDIYQAGKPAKTDLPDTAEAH